MGCEMRRWSMIAAAVALVGAVVLPCTAVQKVHVVGDSMGWTVPQTGGAAFYSSWASNNTFSVGDILIFNFTSGRHTVLQVPKAAFDNCSSGDGIGALITRGPGNVTLSSRGEHFYICTVTSHCPLGQKLAINVSAAATTPPGSAPEPAGGSSSPPPPSGGGAPAPSSSSGVFAGFFLSLLAAAVGFFL